MKPLLFFAALTLIYLAYCWCYPYTACGNCKGGKHFTADGEYWRKCRRCKGSGTKIRLGRKLLGGTRDL
uniref:hypothetical protein n=1 Tax=Amycolatopsis sp. CA-293810 TaxID=3239926 RepID=UPI003F498398